MKKIIILIISLSLIIVVGQVTWIDAESTALPSPAISSTAAVSGTAFIGTRNGLNILDNNGISVLNQETNWVKDIAIERQGRIWIADTTGLRTWDGQNWTEYKLPEGVYSVDKIAVDLTGRVWIGYYKGISVLDGGEWKNFTSENFGLDKNADIVQDIAIDPMDRVWVATNSGVAVLDGSIWTSYDQTSGLTNDNIQAIAVDGEGKIWLAHTDGADVFNGTDWAFYGSKYGKNPQIKVDELSQVKALAIDNQGNIWAGTYDKGVSFFDGTDWKSYNNRENFQGGSINSIYCDNAGRVWLGTDFGLVVFDGKNWLHYTLNASGLLSNDVPVVVVSGSGPSSLPEISTLENGSVTGRVLINGKPVTGAQITMSTEFEAIYSGESPAGNEVYKAATDEKGVFLFDNIPPNRYDLAMITPEEKQYTLLGSVLVFDGGIRDLGELSIK